MSSHEAEFFAQIEPNFVGPAERKRVRGIYAVRLTQGRPRQQMGGTVLIKLRVRIPDAAFAPLEPDVLVIVPERLTHAEPITVEAADPGEPEQ